MNICNQCYEETCCCPNEGCDKKISVCEFDVAAQIISIVKKNHNIISSYKGYKENFYLLYFNEPLAQLI